MSKQTIFVFGSNLAGRHGAGSAKAAYKHFGAQLGVGVGRTGNAYAIPTKDANLCVLSLLVIADYVGQFLQYAQEHPELTFVVVPIGCGLAGYSPSQIAPLFFNSPVNVKLPLEFLKELKQA